MTIYSAAYSTAPIIPFSDHSRANAEQVHGTKERCANPLQELADALFPEGGSIGELAQSAVSLLSIWGAAIQAGLFTVSPLIGVGVPLVIVTLLIVLKIATTMNENRHDAEARNVMEPNEKLINSLLIHA